MKGFHLPLLLPFMQACWDWMFPQRTWIYRFRFSRRYTHAGRCAHAYLVYHLLDENGKIKGADKEHVATFF
jgi:hypothetical protein